MLSCSTDADDCSWYCDFPKEFATLQTSRRKRCCSCKNLMDIGSTVLKFTTWREPKNDIEERIHGDEVPISPLFMCEACGDQYFNLSELGFGIDPSSRRPLSGSTGTPAPISE